MRYVLLVMVLSGCASGITIREIPDQRALDRSCGWRNVDGCAFDTYFGCFVHVRSLSDTETIEHEKRHCRDGDFHEMPDQSRRIRF